MKPAAVALLACLCGDVAHAQDFADLKLRPGQTVRITDETGARITGSIVSVTRDALRVGNDEFAPPRVARIERRGDSLWNGLVIGAAAGLGLAALPSEACLDKSGVECALTGMETGALLGLLVDALHRGYTTVYRVDAGKSVRVTPQIGRHARGVAVSLKF